MAALEEIRASSEEVLQKAVRNEGSPVIAIDDTTKAPLEKLFEFDNHIIRQAFIR